MLVITLREQLEYTRAGYQDEGTWMRFLVDAYTGCGGFQGRVRQPPAGFWGAAASAYSNFTMYRQDDFAALTAEQDSYLDRFPREDVEKFGRRKAVAHYLNYVRPTTQLKVSYLVRKPHKRNNVPPVLAEWIERTGYDQGFRRRALVAAVLGWFPMLVDMPTPTPGARTRADVGALDPYAVLQLPCSLQDYQLNEQTGELVWAKMVTEFCERAAWNVEDVKVRRCTIWTASDFAIYEQRGDAEPKLVRNGPHPFKAVPIVVWRSDTSVEDHVKADSINADIALECRRLFNLISELDEHIRSQVFALLVWPDSSPTPTESLEAGSSNGAVMSNSAKHAPFYLAPPPSVAETLEKRIAATVVEIYRMARVEYDRPSGVATSAQSKQQNFEQTNSLLVSFAESLARADRDTLVLLGRGLGVADDALQAIECTAHQSYAAEDLTLELEQVTTALTISGLGGTFKEEALKRLVQMMLPNLTSAKREEIESEIEAAVSQEDADSRAEGEMGDAVSQAAHDVNTEDGDTPAEPADLVATDGEVKG